MIQGRMIGCSETPRPQGGASSLLPSDLREHRIRSDLWHSSPFTERGILLITRKRQNQDGLRLQNET